VARIPIGLRQKKTDGIKKRSQSHNSCLLVYLQSPVQTSVTENLQVDKGLTTTLYLWPVRIWTESTVYGWVDTPVIIPNQ